MDRLALAAANALVGNAAVRGRDRNRSVWRRFTAHEGAVRVALAGAPRNADIAERPVAFGQFDDAGGRRDPDARLCAGRFVQLPRDRGRYCG